MERFAGHDKEHVQSSGWACYKHRLSLEGEDKGADAVAG